MTPGTWRPVSISFCSLLALSAGMVVPAPVRQATAPHVLGPEANTAVEQASRLTVRQFRNAVSDLVGQFRPVVPDGEPRGLMGEYYKGREESDANRVFRRVDPQVQFDFGTDGPTANRFEPHSFSIVWRGSVLARESGAYEFILRSDQAVRLWVNGYKQPLVDGWVRSANETEFRGSIYLLGGRAYPIQLEFSKSTPGVDDTAAKQGKPAAHASVNLLWRQPNLGIETIPSIDLYPDTVSKTFVVDTAFPPDDRSLGYERGTSFSKQWDDAITSAALETAAYASSNLSELSGIPDGARDRKSRMIEFCKLLVARAFRRPLTPEVERVYVLKQFETAPDVENAVKRVLILTLKSPRFLYPDVGSADDPYEIASELALGLWDTLPDPELTQSAADGNLKTKEQIQFQATRMARDSRAWNKLREFLVLWLKVDDIPEIVKDSTAYPLFSPAIASDLRSSLDLFLKNTVWTEASDYRQLMLSPALYLNGRLASLYGAKLPFDAPFQAVTVAGDNRTGVITQPYLLARFAHGDGTDPIHRGVLIVRSLLGRVLNPPPAAFVPLPSSSHPNLTTRERVALQTKPAMCNACHGLINPLGFTLERFDAIGRVRTADNGKQIDSRGGLRNSDGRSLSFSSSVDLAQYLADTDEAHTAFVRKLYEHMVKRPASWGTVAALTESFARNRYSIRSLMVQIMLASGLPGGRAK